MMRFVFICLWILEASSGSAQKISVLKGILFDSTVSKNIEGASVSIVKSGDSSMVSYTISDEQGRFLLDNIPPGSYRLLISHIGYEIFKYPFTIKTRTDIVDLGTISLKSRSGLLHEVIVNTEIPPVVIRGDTTEFNAGSFKTQPNAAVEELLKKLPGIKIEKNGTIKLNGQKINKVLVDGKSFFGNNPQTATRNLPADAIDKVQVFDKQSDQAELSGFEDGNSSKTINLTFKKDRKKGSFGKLTAGIGNEQRYSAKGNLNRFSESRQASFLGATNNINEELTAIPDMAALSLLQNQGNKSRPNDHNNSKLNRENSIITSTAAGINYNDFTNTNKEVHADYLYSHTQPFSQSGILRKIYLPDTNWIYRQQQNLLDKIHTHSANIVYRQRFSVNESIQINTGINRQDIEKAGETKYLTTGTLGTAASSGFSQNSSDSKSVLGTSEIIYRRRFARHGRTFSVSFLVESMDQNGGTKQYSENSYGRSGSSSASDTLDQHGIFHSTTTGYTIRSLFTEPVFKSSLLELGLTTGYTGSNDHTLVSDFDKFTGNYDLANTLLSNDFKTTYRFYNTSLRLRIQKYKASIILGAALQGSTLNNEAPEYARPLVARSYLNILPSARFKYSFNKYKNITVTYGTSVTAPDSYQLRPLIDKTNPLNIIRGNPDLNQEYNTQIQFAFSTSHPYNGKTLRLSIALTNVKNKIVSSDSIGSLGIRKSMPVNRNGTYYVFSGIDAGCKLPFLKSYLSVSVYSFYSRTQMLVNGSANTITGFRFNPEIKLSSVPSDGLSFSISAAVSANQSGYSIQPSGNSKFLTHQYTMDISAELPGKWLWGSEFSCLINNGLNDGFNKPIPLLNTFISRFLLPGNRGELKLSISDVFNRNTSISRNTAQNFIEDTQIALLKRYILLSFTYSLSKVGLSTTSGIHTPIHH